MLGTLSVLEFDKVVALPYPIGIWEYLWSAKSDSTKTNISPEH